MKILFLIKFYQPFDRGGSEWSTHDLAKLMVKNGHQVTILTPNYGTKTKIVIEGIEIVRFPFIKLKNPKSQLAPFWTNNIIWFIYTSLYCSLLAYKEKVDIIHVQSNEFIPAAVISSKILRKPTLATFRDYQALCSLGFCLWRKDRVCDFSEFFKKDFAFFYQNYVGNKNPIKYLILLAAAIRGRIMQKIIYFFAQRIDYKIAVSGKVAKIFRVNGVGKIVAIHNPVIINTKPIIKPSNEIIYLGRFSKGKGIDIFFNLIPQLLKDLPQAKFKLVGSGYLEKDLKAAAVKMQLEDKVSFTGQIDHQQVLSEVKKAALIAVPSIWQEPLPRSAIEAILSGTPVVATKVGGLKEVVKDKVYGILCMPDENSLKDAIVSCFIHKEEFKKNILADLSKLRKHFTNDVAASYLKIYQKTINV